MPDDPSDPPRKFYDFKDREFERANPPRPAAPGAPGAPPAKPRDIDPSQRIDVHELHRQAATPGPVLNAKAPRRDNDVHGILRDNLARENAAGLNHVSLETTKKRRRLWDFILLLVTGNSVLGALVVHARHTADVYAFVFVIAAVGAFNAGLTWVMWFVMDDY